MFNQKSTVSELRKAKKAAETAYDSIKHLTDDPNIKEYAEALTTTSKALLNTLNEALEVVNLPIETVETTSTIQSRILIVEDYPITAKITRTLMGGLNCHVDIASNGEMAIIQIKKNNYDLIFMDVGLPDMDGCDVTKQIRFNESSKEGHHIPIIGLTAHADTIQKQRCIEAGMNVVFTKPLAKEKLQEILNSFIHKDIKAHETSTPTEEKTHLSPLTGKIIDLELGAKLIGGNEHLAQEMIIMLANNLLEDLMELKEAYQNSNWEIIQEITHKLRGGTSYCGTPRLKEACARLEDYLTSGETEYSDILYLQLLQEIEVIQEYSCRVMSDCIQRTLTS